MTTLGIGPIDHVLCPTDFSPQGDLAFRHALAICLACKAALSLLHVGTEHRQDVDWSRFPNVRDVLIGWGQLQADSDRSAIAEQLGLDVHKTALRDRNNTQGILAYIDKHRTDLLVLGSGPCRGPLHPFRHSVLRDLLRQVQDAACLLLPGKGSGLLADGTPDYRVRKVMIAWDKHTQPRAAIQFAASLLPVLTSEALQITLLHPAGMASEIGQALPGIRGIEWRLRPQASDKAPCRQLFQQGRLRGKELDLMILARRCRFGLGGRLQAHWLEHGIRHASQPLLLVPENY